MNRVADIARFDTPLALDCGAALPAFDVAYETYGSLNRARDNAVLVLHGLTATQHAAGLDETSGRKGWWDVAIGPGKAIDTDRWFVVSVNALGSFGGSIGPASIDPATGRPWGMRFPLVSIGDSAASQAALSDRLGIDRYHAVIGGCFGGFQALEWMARFPGRVGSSAIISATPRTTTHNTALWHVLRKAIRSDPAWNGGDYYDGTPPDAGIGLATMFGALFWMSREVMTEKFGLRRIAGDEPAWGFEPEYAIEEFLDSAGRNAAGRIDANALLYMTRAIDYFDVARGHDRLADAFVAYRAPSLLVSYSGDWRYPAAEMAEIADALAESGAPCRHVTLDSAVGHGGYLYDVQSLTPLLASFLAAPDETLQAA